MLWPVGVKWANGLSTWVVGLAGPVVVELVASSRRGVEWLGETLATVLLASHTRSLQEESLAVVATETSEVIATMETATVTTEALEIKKPQEIKLGDGEKDG